MADVGRPTEYSEEVVRLLEESFRDGANISQACLLSGISRDSYYSWLKLKEGFSDKMTTAQEWPSVIARRAVVKAIGKELENPRNGTENSWKWLERRNKDEFSTRNELTGKDGEQLMPKPILGGQADSALPSNDSN